MKATPILRHILPSGRRHGWLGSSANPAESLQGLCAWFVLRNASELWLGYAKGMCYRFRRRIYRGFSVDFSLPPWSMILAHRE